MNKLEDTVYKIDGQEYYTTKCTANILGVCTQIIYRWRRAKKLPSIIKRKNYFFPKEHIDALASEKKKTQETCYTTREVCALLGLSQAGVVHHVKRNEIKMTRIHAKGYYDKKLIEASAHLNCYTVLQAAKILGIPKDWIYRRVENGMLVHKRRGAKIFLPKNFINNLQVKEYKYLVKNTLKPLKPKKTLKPLKKPRKGISEKRKKAVLEQVRRVGGILHSTLIQDKDALYVLMYEGKLHRDREDIYE